MSVRCLNVAIILISLLGGVSVLAAILIGTDPYASIRFPIAFGMLCFFVICCLGAWREVRAELRDE